MWLPGCSRGTMPKIKIRTKKKEKYANWVRKMVNDWTAWLIVVRTKKQT